MLELIKAVENRLFQVLCASSFIYCLHVCILSYCSVCHSLCCSSHCIRIILFQLLKEKFCYCLCSRAVLPCIKILSVLLIIPTIPCKKCYTLSCHAAIPKPNLNGSLILLKELRNLYKPVLCLSVGIQLTCLAQRNIWHWLCHCLYLLESSRKYLYFLCIYTIILSLYQVVEKCTHDVGLIFSFVTTRATDYSSSSLSLSVQSGSILGEKMVHQPWTIDLQQPA